MIVDKPSDIIRQARHTLADVDPTNYRQTDLELLGYVNHGLAAAAVKAPKLFQTAGNYSCEPLVAEQSISFDDAQMFLSVIRVKNGGAVNECRLEDLNRFHPDWFNDDAGPAVNWMRPIDSDPRRFFIYPKAPANQILEVLYIKNPGVYQLEDLLEDIPLVARTALVDYVIARAESKDDEHVLSARAATHMARFDMILAPFSLTGADNVQSD